MSAPSYVTYCVIASSIGVLVAILVGLRNAVVRAGFAGPERVAILRVGTGLLIAWFGIALALSYAGAFLGGAGRLPTIQFGLLVPIAVGLALLWRSATAMRVLDAVPQSWLIGIQLYRALGVIFLLLLAQGYLPALFALPAGSGDVAVGLLAPVVAVAYARGSAGREAWARAWNVAGLADLAVAITTGFLTAPSPFQLFSLDAPNKLISAFPLVMIPVFLVPLAILLHSASLIKLGRDASARMAVAQT